VSGVSDCPYTPPAPPAAELHTSTDGGTTWRAAWSGPGDGFFGIATGGWFSVAVGAQGDVLTSLDDETWSCLSGACSSAFCGDDFSDLVLGGANQVAVGRVESCPGWPKADSQGQAAVSVGGRTWSVYELECGGLEGVAWDGQRFVAVGGGAGSWAATSADGSVWTSYDLDILATPRRSVAWGRAVFVAVGDRGAVSTSTDGELWTARTSGVSEDLNRVIWDGGQFIAVGSGATIATSGDGSSWAPAEVATSESLYGVTASGDGLVVVGSSGVVLALQEGDLWAEIGSGACLGRPCLLEDVTWDGGLFVAVGADWSPERPIVAASDDAEHWTVFRPSAGSRLHRVVLHGGVASAVGGRRTILRGQCAPMLMRLTSDREELGVGDVAMLTLALGESSLRDTEVTLLSTVPDAVLVPAQVTMPAWLSEVTIPVEAVGAADDVRIVATLPEARGGASTAVRLSVTAAASATSVSDRGSDSVSDR